MVIPLRSAFKDLDPVASSVSLARSRRPLNSEVLVFLFALTLAFDSVR